MSPAPATKFGGIYPRSRPPGFCPPGWEFLPRLVNALVSLLEFLLGVQGVFGLPQSGALPGCAPLWARLPRAAFFLGAFLLKAALLVRLFKTGLKKPGSRQGPVGHTAQQDRPEASKPQGVSGLNYYGRGSPAPAPTDLEPVLDRLQQGMPGED